MIGSQQIDIKNPHDAFFLLPAKKRLDFIINHPSPMKLVRSLPSPELLLTIREVGAEDSLELFSLLNPQQVQEIFDLELWLSDELNIQAAGHYFALLFEASADKAIAQIHGLDIELVGLMFKLTTTIYDLSLGEEPQSDLLGLHSVSPDGRFLVCFHEEAQKKGLAQSLHLFLETLYGRDLPFALRLLENVRFELASGLEEESFRFRNNRLLDMGILPREERLKFFVPISPREREFRQKKNNGNTSSIDGSVALFRMDDSLGHQYPYLKAGLNNLSEEDKTRFWQELVHAGINMHASLSGDFGDKKEQIKVFTYVKFLTELGLFQACCGRIDYAENILGETSAQYLIRLGRTALVTLRKRLVIKSKDPSFVFGPNYCHLDTPLREMARALVLPEPRAYQGLFDSTKIAVNYFSSLDEVQNTVEAVNELLFRAALVGKNGLDNVYLDEHQTLAHSNIFARALVNNYLGQTCALHPIALQGVQKIFDKDYRLSPSFNRHAKEFAAKLAHKFAIASKQDHDEIARRTHQFLTTVLIQMEQNWQLLFG